MITISTHRPRNVDTPRAAAILYGDWGSSKIYILGLAFARTGILYPFFGTMLGWLGVALTGSDTSSNVLFGSLQKITSQQLGIDPILMCAANSAGGVISATPIPNNQPSGLFPQVPRVALAEGRVDYRKVFLLNANADSLELNDAALFVLFQPTAGEIIGIALGTADDTDGSNLTYVAPSTQADALEFGSLAPGDGGLPQSPRVER